MHTSRVLLDWFFTLGACLCIQLQPCLGVPVLVTYSVEPFLQIFTVYGHVCLFVAQEAKVMTTFTFNVNELELRKCNPAAVLAWTELELFVTVHVLGDQVLFIF